MKSAPLLAILMSCAFVHAAAAQPAPTAAPAVCERPVAPGPFDGASSVEQIQAAKTQAAAFIAASDTYQTCLLDDLAARKAAAKAAKTKLDKSAAKDVDALIAANQADKVAVGEAYNAAVRAYRQAHPS